jgi:hypothetical protein
MIRIFAWILAALGSSIALPSLAQQILKVGIQETGAPLNFIDPQPTHHEGYASV